MNYKINLDKVAIPVSKKKSIVIEGFSVEVTDLNVLETVQVLKEIPSVLKGIREAIEGPQMMPGMPLGMMMHHPLFGHMFQGCEGCSDQTDGETGGEEESVGYWPEEGDHVEIVLNTEEQDAPIIGEATMVGDDWLCVNQGEAIHSAEILTIRKISPIE